MVDTQPLLNALHREKVEFVIVGGAAMVIHGSTYLTDDLDIVYARDASNVKRLVAAIGPFAPRLRTSGGDVKFKFDERSILNGLNFTLTTQHGNLDLLAEIAGLGSFEKVRKYAEAFKIGTRTFEVLSLEGLIRAKEATGRKKDLLVIPELKALKELHDKTELPRDAK